MLILNNSNILQHDDLAALTSLLSFAFMLPEVPSTSLFCNNVLITPMINFFVQMHTSIKIYQMDKNAQLENYAPLRTICAPENYIRP